MSNLSETSGRPLASSLHQLEANELSSTAPRRHRRTYQSSDERIGGTKSTSRRRLGPRKETTFLPHTRSSRGDPSTMQRSASPSHMSPESAAVHYTRTGRISKAKKGLKVHNCECGRVSHDCYTAACLPLWPKNYTDQLVVIHTSRAP
jgi:hypothetical protein